MSGGQRAEIQKEDKVGQGGGVTGYARSSDWVRGPWRLPFRH